MITEKSESFDHPRPPPVRWTRSHVNLDAAGNYMFAWTTPFPIRDEVDAVTSQERVESLLTQVRKCVCVLRISQRVSQQQSNTGTRHWDIKTREQLTALDAAMENMSSNQSGEMATKEYVMYHFFFSIMHITKQNKKKTLSNTNTHSLNSHLVQIQSTKSIHASGSSV